MAFDLTVLGRLWVDAKEKKERAEEAYRKISEQLLDLMKQTGAQRVLVGERVLFRIPYYRLSLKDKEEQAIAWLVARGLLVDVAKIGSAKLTQMLSRHPEKFIGIEQFVEVHSHERIGSRDARLAAHAKQVIEESRFEDAEEIDRHLLS